MPPRPNDNPEVPLEDLLIAFRMLSAPGGASVPQIQRALRLPSAESADRIVRQVQRAMRRQPPGSLRRDDSTPGGSRRRHGQSPDRPAKSDSAGRNKPASHARSPRGGKPGAGRKDEQDVPPVGDWYAPHRS